ncbi:MAG: hypothetical protein GQ531_11325 [Sulfurovum sp.]|nr:hypothetical protein [Sulfurovum sp.]
MFKRLVTLLLLLGVSLLCAEDYHSSKSEAWKSSNINTAATVLYGKEKFAHIKKSLNIELIAPRSIVRDAQHVPIRVRTSIPAKSVAIFQNVNPSALVAVFSVNSFGHTDIEIPIRMERKGTVFAVIESMSGVLYYARAYIDVLCLPCMAQGK